MASAVDIYSCFAVAPDSPARYAAAVTPDSGNDLPYRSRAIYVGGAGNLIVQMNNGNGGMANLTFNAVPAGTILPICVTRVLATSDCTLLVAMW